MRIIQLVMALLWVALSSVGAAQMTYFDDRDALYNGGVIDAGGTGRPASGSGYDGASCLTVWGDTNRSTARQADRVAAFVRSDVGLDHLKDWTIELDVTNDLVSPDIGFSMWLLNERPDETFLNQDFTFYRPKSTFWFSVGDQLADDDAREGFRLDYVGPDGNHIIYTSPRLDPDPDATAVRQGHNYVTVKWLASEQKYIWTITNKNGSWSREFLASQLALQPVASYFVAGTVNNNAWMASGWTIQSLDYSLSDPPPPGPVRIGSRKQLLVDDFAIAEKSGLTRELGTVIKANSGRPIFPACSAYSSVMFDSDQGKFKLWYRGAGVMKYAESQDGFNWTYKAELTGLDTDTFTCFIDPHETDPNHRYKGAYCPQTVMAALAHSADGIHWAPYNNGEPVTYRAADTMNQILWDEDARLYRLYTRTDFGTGGGPGEIRGNRAMTNPDVKANPTNWTDLGSWRFDQEGPEEYLRRQVYQLTDWIYEGVHFGLVAVFDWPDDVSEGPVDYYMRHEKDTINYYIATSRDGHSWDLSWVYAGKPMVPRGPSGSFDKDMIFPTVSVITRDGKHWFYYNGCNERHSMPRYSYSWWLGLAWLRLDGMVYLEAADQSGTLLTKPLVFEGDELHVNSDSSGGSLRVEILDAGGEPLPGYSAADCDPMTTDSTDYLVTWKGKCKLEGAPAAGVRLKFYVTRSRLFSFQFRAGPPAVAAASVSEAKDYADGVLISVPTGIVTACYDGSFYIQDRKRASGIKVVSPAPVAEGGVVTVAGVLQTRNGEREIVARDVR